MAEVTDLLKELGVKAARPINSLCDKFCARYNHLFCGGELAYWEDHSECEHCGEPFILTEDEDDIVPPDYKHADGGHTFYPKLKSQPWPLPQICNLVTRGIMLGVRWEKPPTNVEGLH